jgi:hypothetical protein
VAYTAWQYYEATGDLAFLVDHGAEMILEIARFWSSAASYDPGRNRFVIRGVMGPDEFHTGYPGADEAGIDNNAYTNIMAAWVLQRGLDVLAVLPPRRRMELSETLGLRQEECSRWEELTRRIFVPFHDGVTTSHHDSACRDVNQCRSTRPCGPSSPHRRGPRRPGPRGADIHRCRPERGTRCRRGGNECGRVGGASLRSSGRTCPWSAHVHRGIRRQCLNSGTSRRTSAVESGQTQAPS